jgi:hypothetical protein
MLTMPAVPYDSEPRTDTWRGEGRSMAQEITTPRRRCKHAFPAMITATNDGRRARCMNCGTLGPLRTDLAAAMQALREMR